MCRNIIRRLVQPISLAAWMYSTSRIDNAEARTNRA